MYSVKKEIKFDRQERRKRNKTAAQQVENYTRPNGDMGILILHPTKGIRDRNQTRMLRHEQIVRDIKEAVIRMR